MTTHANGRGARVFIGLLHRYLPETATLNDSQVVSASLSSFQPYIYAVAADGFGELSGQEQNARGSRAAFALAANPPARLRADPFPGPSAARPHPPPPQFSPFTRTARTQSGAPRGSPTPPSPPPPTSRGRPRAFPRREQSRAAAPARHEAGAVLPPSCPRGGAPREPL